MWKWEKIDTDTYRMRVPTGWIIRVTIMVFGGAGGGACMYQVFVPEDNADTPTL